MDKKSIVSFIMDNDFVLSATIGTVFGGVAGATALAFGVDSGTLVDKFTSVTWIATTSACTAAFTIFMNSSIDNDYRKHFGSKYHGTVVHTIGAETTGLIIGLYGGFTLVCYGADEYKNYSAPTVSNSNKIEFSSIIGTDDSMTLPDGRQITFNHFDHSPTPHAYPSQSQG